MPEREQLGPDGTNGRSVRSDSGSGGVDATNSGGGISTSSGNGGGSGTNKPNSGGSVAITPCYYSLLGLRRQATTEEIDKAFRRLALTAHPDKGGGAARFQQLRTAHEVLRDPAKRAAYDELGPSLRPSPGSLIGKSTVGRLMPLALAAAASFSAHLAWALGAISGVAAASSAAMTAGAGARAGGHARRDGTVQAAVAGLVVGSAAAALVVAAGRGAGRLLRR